MLLESLNINGETVEVPVGLCLLAYRGSQAHGMYVPSSDPDSIDDVDLMGIVCADEHCYLGLTEWGSRGTWERKQGKWDSVHYELRKMFALLLQGNPNVLSMLWCRDEDYILKTEAGQRIIDSRSLFVGRHVYNAFAGYAYAQLEKMETRDPAELREYLAITAELKYRAAHPNEKGIAGPVPDRSTGAAYDVSQWGTDKLLARLRHYQKKGENIGYLGDKRKQLVLRHGYDAKNAAHCIRLLRMCAEFMDTGELEVYRHDAAELLQIKRGEWPLDQIKEHAKELFEGMRTACGRSNLPEGPARAAAEALMIDILRAHLRVT